LAKPDLSKLILAVIDWRLDPPTDPATVNDCLDWMAKRLDEASPQVPDDLKARVAVLRRSTDTVRLEMLGRDPARVFIDFLDQSQEILVLLDQALGSSVAA
jgi:hypothetical protein